MYSIVYIYLINSRLDVTTSVRHHFRTATLSWCQISGKNSRNRRENLTVIELTRNNNNSNKAGKFKEEFIAFQEAFREDFEYSDFFRDHQLRPQHIGDIRRDYIHFVDSNWDLKAVVLIQVSYDQYKSYRATRASELRNQSFRGTKIQNTVKNTVFDTFSISCNG